MLHSTLSALLVSVASRYAELSPSDVGIGIDGGRLVIDNVQLRADTFNGPSIPFRVHEGRAGRLRVNVPWSALSSTPVTVYLENVHLIAGPKQHDLTEDFDEDKKGKPPHNVSSHQAEWYQTMVGRLLFNVSIEVYGLKVEYRDDDCVGIISVASLAANSAGPDWNQRFLSLLSDLDPEQPEVSAVSMRKLVKLSGVHWVMIPRLRDAPPAAEGLAINENGRSPRFSERHLDLSSYESKSPILDGIAITIKVLMCTGMAMVGDSISPGLHAEVDIDLEEANVILTAQQIKWMDQILKEGFGVAKNFTPKQSAPHAAPNTKRRPRPLSASNLDVQSESLHLGIDVLPKENRTLGQLNSNRLSSKTGGVPPPEERDSTSLTENYSPTGATEDSFEDKFGLIPTEVKHNKPEGEGEPVLVQDEGENSIDQEVYHTAEEESEVGGLRSFWNAIVGEYADETVDDVAVALGLENAYVSSGEQEQPFGKASKDEADNQYARAAVNTAANAGGRTFELRLKTPDLAAQDEIEKLKEELGKERERREELENVEEVLSKAEDRVKDAEDEIQVLQERNISLQKELRDLESLTSQSGRNKDAMIRQMETALSKAERNLQAIYQARYQLNSEHNAELKNTPEAERISPRAIEQNVGNYLSDARDHSQNGIAGIGNEKMEKNEKKVEQPVADDIEESLLKSQPKVYTDESSRGEKAAKEQTVSISETSEEPSIIPISEAGQNEKAIAGNDISDAKEDLPDVLSGTEHEFGYHFENDHSGMNAKQIEFAMSADGLSLV